MNKIIKLSMVVTTATLLISCGGGSSANGGPEEGIISEGDKCIDIAEYDAVGKYKSRLYGPGQAGFVTLEILNSNKNSDESKITTESTITEGKVEFYGYL